ncbi:hypothetical protein [Lysobacter panacisoli]|uniref:Uncharacterized protein n=1 Tax=Lysobacter panacisoli TaxID=1255263 RepID=A0ABP9L2T9_9GAMM|nr:hypothetical protein [Lysobacter panacisoli]
MEAFKGILARSIVLAVALAAASMSALPQVKASEVPARALSAKNRVAIERMLSVELQKIVDRQERIEGQAKYASVNVTLDTNSRALIINLSKSYVPKFNGAAFEDLQHELSTAALELLRDIISIDGVRYRFDGRPIEYYIPDVLPPASHRARVLSVQPRKVAVSAGHGVYFHHGFNDWRPQRDPSNGVTEDFITPTFVTELGAFLASRSGVVVANPRSTSGVLHSPSGQSWWKMGARSL